MIQRLRSRQQFQAVLANAPVAKTPHFALHRLAPGPVAEGSSPLFLEPGPWLGVLVPKRWARRAVTRNAIRRQAYATAPASTGLPVAAHVVRLRSGFDRARFVSASSTALKQAVREELLQLWARALRAARKPLPAMWREWPQRTLIALVQGYRLLLSPWLGSGCRFEPTCSAYALQALQRHGALTGSRLAAWRLVRCHPWCDGGHDPVPAVPPPGLFTRLISRHPDKKNAS